MDDKLKYKISREYARYMIIQYFIKLGNFPQYISWLEKLLSIMASQQKHLKNVFDELDEPVNASQQKHLKNVFDEPVNPSIKLKDRQDQIFILNNKYVDDCFVKLEIMANRDEVKHIKNNIYNKIEEFFKTQDYDIPNYKIKEEDNIYVIKCNNFYKRISKNRIDALKNMLQDKHKKYWQELIIICYIRYECLLSLISQWSMPLTYYKYIYDNYNVRFETHSSPLNCQLMIISNKIGYCSLFYDTDKYFGSLGNVFDIDFSKLRERYYPDGILGISVVPMPELQHGLRKTFKMMYKNLNLQNILFIMVTNKIDNKYYPKIILEDGLLYEKILYEGQYYFENAVTDEQTIQYNWYKHINILFVGNKKILNKSFYSIGKSFGIKLKPSNSIHYINKLKREYHRYLLVLEMQKLSAGTEWNNIYERFLITMGNIKRENKIKNQDYVLCDVPLDHDVYKIMKREMVEKNISNIDKIINSVHDKIRNFLVLDFNETDIKYYQNGEEFVCEDYKVTINTTRKMTLIKMLSAVGKGKYFLELLLILFIRYKCLSLGGQQWNLPFKLYFYLNTTYGLQLECFASPLNSQTILLDKNARFCSLFYDTDKYFGSYGNLFETDIVKISKDFNGQITMSLFPPNIEDLVYKMIDLMNQWFKYVPRLRVFTGYFKWTSFPPLQMLESHQHLKYIREYKIGEYYFENSIDQNVPKILRPGKNPYILYVLANFELQKDEPPYESIDNYMKSY